MLFMQLFPDSSMAEAENIGLRPAFFDFTLTYISNLTMTSEPSK